ncbi:MAG TPA: ATP-binding protein [Vicinamibacteria bacterium]|jgi:signal transduction histidine kinase/ActR/RegA family two-component response regulator
MKDGPEERAPRLLLVGGPPAARERLHASLGSRFEVEDLPDGAALLDRVRERPPDLILTASPSDEALKTLRELRSDAAARVVPVLLWGIDGEGERAEAFEAGADDVLPGSISERELRARLAARREADRARGEAMRLEAAARTEAEASNRAKDEFIAMISHELRTPLGAILIWTQLLRNEQLDEGATARALGMIERSTKTLAQLIDDLLDVSRIIAGKLRIEPRPVDLPAVVDAALAAAQLPAEGKNIRIDYVVEASLEPVSGDPGRLQQVVGNLLANAIKFTPEGGRVELKLGRSRSHARLVVSDTGIGIDPAFLPYIFERFRQADSTSTRTQKGLGLGLAITRHLVELHGGSIEAASPGPGQGATFTVTLPLLLHPARATPSQEGGDDSSATLEGLRILLVDDEDDAREAMAVLLRQAGAEVIAVPSAPLALEALEREKLDVLLSDIAMPGEDGYALIAKVRSLPAAHGGAIAAAALTAYATAEDRARVLRAGYHGHFAKPIDPGTLVSAVAALAERSTARPRL